MHVASRELDNAYRRELRKLGLTYPQYMTMLLLWEQGEQVVNRVFAALNYTDDEAENLRNELRKLITALDTASASQAGAIR